MQLFLIGGYAGSLYFEWHVYAKSRKRAIELFKETYKKNPYKFNAWDSPAELNGVKVIEEIKDEIVMS